MSEAEKTIHRREKLLSTTDLSNKNVILQKHTNKINDLDEDFFKMIQEVVVEEQEAEIIRKLEDKIVKMKKSNQLLLEDTDRKIAKMVRNLHEQVEDAKEQTLKITYEDPLSLETF